MGDRLGIPGAVDIFAGVLRIFNLEICPKAYHSGKNVYLTILHRNTAEFASKLQQICCNNYSFRHTLTEFVAKFKNFFNLPITLKLKLQDTVIKTQIPHCTFRLKLEIKFLYLTL